MKIQNAFMGLLLAVTAALVSGQTGERYVPPPPPQATPDPAASADPLFLRAQKANEQFKFTPDRVYGFISAIPQNAPDADFYIGPCLVDKTPIAALKLPVGEFDYRFRLPRHEDSKGKVSVSTQIKAEIKPILIKRKGVAVVRTHPAGATLFVNQKPLGTTAEAGLPVSALDPGTYIVKIQLQGFKSCERSLKVVDGDKTGIDVILTEDYGSLLVYADVPESYVYVNNIFWGRTPLTVSMLRPGKSVVKVENEECAPFVKTVMIKSGSIQKVDAVMTKDRTVRDVNPYGKLQGNWGDKDGDGIPNDMDKCVIDPEDVDGYIDNDGCPDPDNDIDGISDIKEQDNKYRDMPEDFDGFEDADGAPDFDNDKDYVPDTLDLCLNTAEDRDGFEDLDGCPEPDNDTDGVPDSADQAINEPEDIDGFQDADGVQDLDNDNDGIRDYMDACPGAAEVFNNFQDDDGCPDERVAEPRPGVMRQIPYMLGAPLPEAVFVQLDSAYNALIAYPAMRIMVKVHCDNKGRLPKKTKETEDKAQLLQRYLDYRGTVDRSRYSVAGAGAADPIASNVSDEGRAKNTRVEIRRVK